MTDDSTSKNTEDEESADGDGRASDGEETPLGRDEETSDEPDEETPTDDEPEVDDDPETDDSPAERATVSGNPMAGIEPEPKGSDADPDEGDAPTRPVDLPGTDVSSDATPEETAGDETAEDETAPDETIPGGPAPDGTAPQGTVAGEGEQPSPADFVPEDVRKYERFKKMDGARYERVNEFLRERTYVTAREWAIARLCADFRTETGVEMTKIGENLPRLVPFMNDTYTPQAVNQARHSFEEKVRKSGATFLYGAMSGFFTAEQLDDVMYEITEVAKFLLEVEGVDLTVEEELEAEDRILSVMREVREQSEQLRHEGVECPECGHEIGAEGDD